MDGVSGDEGDDELIYCVSEKTWCRTFCDNFINC